MSPLLAFNFGPMEILVVLAIGLLLFGTRLPKLARSMGQSVNEFKHGLKEGGKPSESEQGEEK